VVVHVILCDLRFPAVITGQSVRLSLDKRVSLCNQNRASCLHEVCETLGFRPGPRWLGLWVQDASFEWAR